jgi:hypothetical protein
MTEQREDKPATNDNKTAPTRNSEAKNKKKDEKLEEALEGSFPASDPPGLTPKSH